MLRTFAVARERDDFHTLGLVPNACQPRNWKRKPRRVSPLSGVFLCPDTQRKTGRLRAELRYGSTQGTPNLPAQQKTENEQRRQVRRCGFLSSFLALFRAVAVQLFGGGFCFSHSFLAFFWLSLAAHFLRGRNAYRLAHTTTRPARMSTAAMAAARLTAKRRGRCSRGR